MRVTVAIPAFLPARAYGGPIEVVLRLAPELAARGVEVTVVTSTARAPGVADLPTGRDRVGNLTVWRLPTPWIRGWGPWVRWGPRVPLGDVVHVFGAWNGLSYAAMAAARRARVPWIWEPSGMLVAAGRNRTAKRALTPWHARWARRAAAVVWTSRREATEAGLAALAHGMLRPNPLPPPPPMRGARTDLRAQRGWASDELAWGYLGRIAERKGIERVLAAWRRARPTRARLVFAGPVESPRLAAQIAATPNATHVGALDSDDRWDFLRALDALVLVPDWGENFGYVVAEAAAIGTPVLVSAAVGAREWLADDPGVVCIDDAELEARLAEGRPPRPPLGPAAALAPGAVAARQVEIYRAATARAASMGRR